MNFVDLRDYLELEYELTCDDANIAAGVIASPRIPSIPPRHTGKVYLSLPAIPERGRIYLKVSYILRKADTFREEGMLLGFDEISLSSGAEESASAAGEQIQAAPFSLYANQTVRAFAEEAAERAGRMQTLHVQESDRRLVIRGENFTYTYSKLYGVFEKMNYAGRELLDRPMELNIWRAPTDNDMYIRREWERAMYHRAGSRAYTTQYRSTDDGNSITISSCMSMTAVTVQRLMDIDTLWTVTSDGRISVHMDVTRNMEFPELPRFGLRLFLPESMQNAVYYGMGPLESYPDKHRASWHGLFAAPVRDLHEDYIRPQENGSRCDCDYVTLYDNTHMLTAYSHVPFSFNASVYTQEELTAREHNYGLEPCGSTVLCLDARQDGIGSNSCGPRLQSQYRFDDRYFTYDMTLLPVLDPAE
jgi:beta-galactosidase